MWPYVQSRRRATIGAGNSIELTSDKWCSHLLKTTTLTKRGIRIEFVKECLSFTGEDSPMANLLLSVMGAFAEFERALIGERQREGIALAKQRGAYRGRKKALADNQVVELRRRAGAGEQKSTLAREFGISRETLYQYLKLAPSP